MKLRPKLFLLLIGVIILPLIVGIAFTYMDIKTSINNIEIDKGKIYIASANQYLNLLESNHGDSYLAWTSWDDYYNAVEDKNLDWINNNILASAKEDSNSEVILTLDKNAKVLTQINAVKEWQQKDFKNFDLFEKLNENTNYVSGIEKTSDGLYITTIVKLVKSDDPKFKNSNGFTVYARKLKDSILEKGKTMIGIDIAIKIDNGELLSTKKNVKMENSDSKSFKNNQVMTYTKIMGESIDIQAELPFIDSSGTQVGILHIEATSKSEVISLNKLKKNSVLLTSTLMLSVIFVCILIIRTILTPLSLILTEAEGIAEGDLTSENKMLNRFTLSKDEIGQFTRAFETMKGNLKAIISVVKKLSKEVTELSENMAEAARSSEKSSQQISSSTNIMAEGASMQNEQVVSIQLQIEASVKESEKGYNMANEMLTTAKFSSDIAINGRNQIKEVIDHYEWFSKTLEFATESIQNLGKRSNEIGEFVSIITGIASQTKLLSLNASIEASRAGEDGKGFSIVASEIKKLSESSTNAAKTIAELISDAQIETSITVKSMESNLEKVNTQLSSIKNGGEALETIVKKVKETENSASDIYSIYKQLQVMSENINRSVNDISSVIGDNAAYAEEVAASSDEQYSSMGKIVSTTSELASLAENLQKEISKFKSDTL